MGTKERILTIRLMEKLGAAPQWGKALGIEVAKTAPPGSAELQEEREEQR